MPGSLAAATNLPRPLNADEKVLDLILDEWPRIRETLYSGQGADDGDSCGLVWTPPVYTRTCWELDTCLTNMRRNVSLCEQVSPEYHKMYVNLRSWYLTYERQPELPKKKVWRRQVRDAYEVISSQPKPRWKEQRRLGDPRWVFLGVAWLAQDFSFKPSLPEDLGVAA